MASRVFVAASDSAMSTSESDALAVVKQVEIHFAFPFKVTKAGRTKMQDLFQLPDDDKVAKLLGDDGHLQFRECKHTFSVTPTTSALASTRVRFGSVSVSETAFSRPTSVKRSALSILHDSRGNAYTIHDTYVRLLSFDTGLVRFAISANQAVTVQDVLNLQNSVMRLNKTKVPRLKTDVTNKIFEPLPFLMDIIGRFVGIEGEHWERDSHTDRLFTYTLAAIADVGSAARLKNTVYNIGQMEWDASAPVDDKYLDEYLQNNCYLRFAEPTEGLYMTFHQDGGATILFDTVANLEKKLPMFSNARHNGVTGDVRGTSRPLGSFSMMEAILFQRTYLRYLDNTMHQLIVNMDQRKNSESLEILQDVHRQLIKFRANYGTRPVSSSSSCVQQMDQWTKVAGLSSVTNQLTSNIKDLHTFYSDISAEESQQRLDTLAVVLGFLGVAQLVTDIYTNYIESGSTTPEKLIWVPALVTAVLLLLAIAFTYYTRSAI
eukprot:m.21513 g.21513  ORF g.21513 m.21513 type:complete len:490 (-) comp8291_c0_seq1:250-1719(-)